MGIGRRNNSWLQKSRTFCRYCYSSKNNHDIGFKWNNNEYELVADLMFWDQTYSVDKFLNQVHQRYAFNLITKVSGEQNLQFVETENLEDGSIRLLLRKFN